ncbi:MAG: hypothetical protein QOJ03_2573 [Frankiaceae bacterium]|nr:hypothetical protein [Frankiaceae bacterium]
MGLFITIAVVAVLLAVYASWAAGRLDRLHARVDAAGAALEDQLKVRAAAAEELATQRRVPAPVAMELARAAAKARLATGLDHDREVIESALSRALQEACATFEHGSVATATAVDASTRAAFARRFHNDAVRDALVVRRRWVVRLLHLAGHAPRPAYFEIADAPLEFADVAAAAAPYD